MIGLTHSSTFAPTLIIFRFQLNFQLTPRISATQLRGVSHLIPSLYHRSDTRERLLLYAPHSAKNSGCRLIQELSVRDQEKKKKQAAGSSPELPHTMQHVLYMYIHISRYIARTFAENPIYSLSRRRKISRTVSSDFSTIRALWRRYTNARENNDILIYISSRGRLLLLFLHGVKVASLGFDVC